MAAKSLSQQPAKKRARKKSLPPGVVIKSGRWYVRVRYRAEDGKRHAAWRECTKSPKHAKEMREALQAELKQHGHESLRSARMTFGDLADYFETTYLQPAIFSGGRKISGRRSVATPKSAIRALRAYFATKPLRSITHGNLEAYRSTRLQTPVTFKDATKERPRTIASVNRELSLLRRMLNVALQEGWLHRSPFTRGDSLISGADERKRDRILTAQEEGRLLSLCVGAYAHVRPLIICALDTGMRWGEMTKIRVGDVDFGRNVISVQATHTKTLRARRVEMSPRVQEELLSAVAGKHLADRVFELTTVKRAWTTLRKKAGLQDLRWHDLRHTNATRIERSGRVSLAQLARHLGHSDTNTTYRYVNQDEDSIREIAAVLDEFNKQGEAKEESEAVN
jgi:integrase